MAPSGGLVRNYAAGLSLLIRLLDVAVCILAGVLAFLLRFGSYEVSLHVGYPVLIFVGALLVLVIFPLTGLYQSWRAHSLLVPIARALAVWVVVFAAVLALLVLAKQSAYFSRLWLADWFALQSAFLILVRIGMFGGLAWLRQHGYNQRFVVVVGDGAQGQGLVRQAAMSVSAGFVVTAIFNRDSSVVRAEQDWLHPAGSLRQYLTTHTVDEVWIVLPLNDSHLLSKVLAECDGIAASVRYVPELQDLYLLNHGVTEVLGTPMIDLRATPMQGHAFLLKALEDRLLAAFILVLIGPLMLLIACGIKLTSKGPILFRQKRNGWDGREIVVYKFRTMRLHQEDPGCVTQASPDDGRVTRLGAFLRRTSLDELPQFINVLQGRMSIVGPRPHAVEHNDYYRKIIDRYNLRHVVKPGITGWAQVNGLRGITETPDKMQQRVDYDLFYINNWSLLLDLKIILLTVTRGFVNKNAY